MSARDRFLAEFDRVASQLPGQRHSWLVQRRRAAIEAFAATGMPTQRDEEWKYTSLAALDRSNFTILSRPGPSDLLPATAAAFALADAHLLVFVDGHHAPHLSRLDGLPAGVTITAFAAVDTPGAGCGVDRWSQADSHGAASVVATLNAAFVTDGACIRLAPGTIVERPIQLLSIVTVPGSAVHLHHCIEGGEGSRASIVERYLGVQDAVYLTNATTEILVGPGARIEHCRLQDESRKAVHLAAVDAMLGRSGELASNVFAFGASLARTDIGVGLADEDARCALNGLYVAAGRQHLDHHTRIEHAQPRGTSRELYKGIVDGAARAVFNGKVIVREGAQQTDAEQSNRNLLLSENAEVDTRPQLEIYADDVKCAHGATVGQLDAEQMFYLRSRGIDAAAARSMLMHAFALEVIDRVGIATLRARLARRLLAERDPGMEFVR